MDEPRRPVRFGDLLRTLAASQVDFIIVGGVAAVLEGAPVSTFDLDVLYSNSKGNVERLLRALDSLQAVYLDPAGRTLHPKLEHLQKGGHHLLRTRYGRLDVLATIGDNLTYEELAEHTNTVDVHGLSYRVLDLATLISIKEAVGRPKDIAVLDLLRQTLAARS